MKASKDHKMDRKRKHKALAVAKTEKSRKRRLDNKAKRDEIHAIDPDINVKIIDQIAYDEDGAVIKVENGKITKWLPLAVPEVFRPEIEEVEAVEVDDVNKFQTIVKKWSL